MQNSSNTLGPTDSNAVIAISWEDHRRTREICDWLGIPLHVLTFDGGRVRRYLKVGTATIRLLLRKRPRVLLIQTPSVFLGVLARLMRPFCGGYRIVMDAHNEAVVPFAYTQWPIPLLHRHCLRNADTTIVTNSALESPVTAVGGRPHVLPDRLPRIPIEAPMLVPPATPFRVMVVATYAPDEPISEIIESARTLGPDYVFDITGRATKLPESERARLPANVRQTGFLSEDAYWQLMNESHAVLDFTLKPNCLVCGAYEALAMRRPMILSDNPATEALFGRVAVLSSSHEPDDIAAAVKACRDRYEELCAATHVEQARFLDQWQKQAVILRSRIASWLDPSSTITGQARA